MPRSELGEEWFFVFSRVDSGEEEDFLLAVIHAPSLARREGISSCACGGLGREGEEPFCGSGRFG